MRVEAIKPNTPLYIKTEVSGDRTSQFAPWGGFLEEGEIVEIGEVQEDHTGKFAEVVGQPGKFIHLADVKYLEAA